MWWSSKRPFWVQISRGFLENFESMNRDLKNTENRIQKYLNLKANVLEQNEKKEKTILFSPAVSRNPDDLLKSNELSDGCRSGASSARGADTAFRAEFHQLQTGS